MFDQLFLVLILSHCNSSIQVLTTALKLSYMITYVCQNFGICDVCQRILKSIYHTRIANLAKTNVEVSFKKIHTLTISIYKIISAVFWLGIISDRCRVFTTGIRWVHTYVYFYWRTHDFGQILYWLHLI